MSLNLPPFQMLRNFAGQLYFMWETFWDTAQTKGDKKHLCGFVIDTRLSNEQICCSLSAFLLRVCEKLKLFGSVSLQGFRPFWSVGSLTKETPTFLNSHVFWWTMGLFLQKTSFCRGCRHAEMLPNVVAAPRYRQRSFALSTPK